MNSILTFFTVFFKNKNIPSERMRKKNHSFFNIFLPWIHINHGVRLTTCPSHQNNNMIDWIVFYAVSAIFKPYNGGDYKLKVISLNFQVSLAALTSLHFIEIQWNGLLRARRVVILDMWHHLTSHQNNK